jgi:hypothetical protein
MPEQRTQRTYPIVGSFYRPPAKAILSVLSVGAQLTLRNDPYGTVCGVTHTDPTAIAVYVDSNQVPDGEDLRLAGGECGFRIDEERMDDPEDWARIVLDQPEWHLGYIPKVEAARLRLAGDTPATFAIGIDGKYLVTIDEGSEELRRQEQRFASLGEVPQA